MRVMCASDLHLRDDRPRCRVDNWYETTRSRLQWLIGLMNENKCPLLIAGDITDKGSNNQTLENLLLEEFGKALFPIWTINGQHDVQYHSQNWLRKSTYWVMHQAKVIEHIETKLHNNIIGDISGFSFGTPMTNGTGIAMCHRSVYPTTAQIPFFMGEHTDTIGADELLDQFDYELIVSGDVHMPFYLQRDGKTLINPGGLFRQKSDKKYTIPTVYLYEDGVVTGFEAPIVIDNVVQEYLIAEKERDTRISAFVERLSTSAEIGLSFRDNVELGFKTNKLRQVVKELVLKAMEDEL